MEFEHSSAAVDMRSVSPQDLKSVVTDRPLRDEALGNFSRGVRVGTGAFVDEDEVVTFYEATVFERVTEAVADGVKTWVFDGR